jgi:protein TonB
VLSDFQAKTLPNTAKHVVAFITMLLGPIVVFGMVLLMNRMEVGTDRNLFKEVSEVAVVKTEALKQQSPVKKPTPKPKPKSTRPMKATAPIPQLAAGLSGLDFGMNLGGLEDGLANNAMNAGDKLLNNKDSSVGDATDTLPQPKLKSPFIYPKGAKSKGVTGYVVLSVLVEVDGAVDKVEVVESSPEGVFDESAIAGIKNWRFSPGLQQGKPVKTWVKQKIRFSLG